MNSPFPVRLRAASIVPRWSIVHTQKPDYVAGHSFYVAIYSMQIADLISWKGSSTVLLWSALTHDLDELVTGDIVAPVKRHIVDASLASKFIGKKLQEMMPGIAIPASKDDALFGDEIRKIVKAADQLDALLYALGEQALGNQIIAARIPSAYDKFREAWFKLPTKGSMLMYDERLGSEGLPFDLANLWLDVVVSAINEHRDPAMYDIERP